MNRLQGASMHRARSPLQLWEISVSWVAAGSAAAISLFALAEHTFAIAVAYMLFGFVGTVTCALKGRTAIKIFLFVFGIATLSAIWLNYSYIGEYGVPYWEGGTDEIHYEEIGGIFARNYGMFDYSALRRELVVPWHNSVGYLYVVGLLTKFGLFLGGAHTMIPRLFNATCLALVAVVTYGLGKRLLLSRSVALTTGILAGCLPIMMWVSVQTLRDIIVTLLLLTIMSLWVPTAEVKGARRTVAAIVWTGLLLVALSELRMAHAFVASCVVAVAIASDPHTWRSRNLAVCVVPLMTVIIASITVHIDMLLNNLALFLEGMERYQVLRAEGAQAGLSRVVFEAALFPFGWLMRVAYALVSPLPVVYQPAFNAWLSIGTFIHILFLPFLFMGIRRAVRMPAGRPVVVAFALLLIGMSMFTFTGRHIVQYLPIAALLAAVGYETYRGRKVWVHITAGAIAGTMGVVYMGLKVL